MNVQVKALVFPEETNHSFSHNPRSEERSELSGLEVTDREGTASCVWEQ